MKGTEIAELLDILGVSSRGLSQICNCSERGIRALIQRNGQPQIDLQRRISENVAAYIEMIDLSSQQKERVLEIIDVEKEFKEYTLPGEEWKTVPDFDSYRVSNYGRVWNIIRCKPTPIQVSEWNFVKNLNKVKKTRKYYRVQLYDRNTGELQPYMIHRLVAEVWIPNDDPEHKTIVDHIDNDPMNNMVSNLRWVTNGQNIKNSHSPEQAYTRWLIEKTQGQRADENSQEIQGIEDISV